MIRAPRGLLLSAIGAAVIIAATFQPWYAVGITPAGVFAAQQELNAVTQHGSPALRELANEIGLRFSASPAHRVATVSAHDSMKYVSALLLVLAGAALLVALWRVSGMTEGGGGLIAALGVVAIVSVLYRMVDPPNPAVGDLTMSLSWGSWLALAGAAAIAGGGMTSPRAFMYRPRPRHAHSPTS